ncbi:hypothetical protein ACIOKD_30755 [Streptomyces sp. NPDC087844]|uniref:hypothetical protein n=1 Tax=Streptomyces sp. NPDC087844 TaxID=3365805 RepID=UPI00382DC5B6
MSTLFAIGTDPRFGSPTVAAAPVTQKDCCPRRPSRRQPRLPHRTRRTCGAHGPRPTQAGPPASSFQTTREKDTVKARSKIFATSVMGTSANALNSHSVRKGASAVAFGLAVLATQGLGTPPAAAASIPPGSVTVVAKSSPVNTLATKVPFRADCPAGQRVLGGGAFTVGGVHAVITEMQPIHTASGDSFEVSAAADQFGISVGWNFQVFAFCASVPATLGVEIVSQTNAPTSGATDQTSAQCSTGKQLIGAGGKIANGNGQVDLGIATNASGSFANRSAAIAKEDADGFAGNYTVTGYSVCARPTAFGDFQQVKTQSNTTAASQKRSLSCPSGLRLTGLAGNTAAPGTHLQEIAPLTTTAPNIASFGAQSSVPQNGPWTMETTVFCAK